MQERFEIVENAVISMLDGKQYSALRAMLVTMNAADIANLFTGLKEEAIPRIFRLLPKELAAEVFVEMEPDQQELLIRGFSDSELKEVVDELYADDAADLAEEMPANVVKRILRQATPEMRNTINQLLRYPENSAGSIMTTEYVTLRPEMTVGDSILRIRRQGFDKETIYTCYVTHNKRLQGIVTVKDLLLCPDDTTPVQEIMETNTITVTTHTDQEEVAQMMAKYNFLAIPVVDGDQRMVGIVTVDDAMDVLEEETTEDIEIMAGMLPSEKPYLKNTIWEIFLHRIPWLILLMVSATFTGMIITSFEDALAAQVVLTAFIPMLMDTGGNSGSQSSVTIIRALSLDELKLADLPRVLWKEIRTAFLCGLVLAVACFAKLMLVDRLLMHNASVTLTVAAVVCVTMLVTVLLAKIVGATLPMVAKAMKLDPAVMASPFITTIVDAVSLLIYFLFARTLLHI